MPRSEPFVSESKYGIRLLETNSPATFRALVRDLKRRKGLNMAVSLVFDPRLKHPVTLGSHRLDALNGVKRLIATRANAKDPSAIDYELERDEARSITISQDDIKSVNRQAVITLSRALEEEDPFDDDVRRENFADEVFLARLAQFLVKRYGWTALRRN